MYTKSDIKKQLSDMNAPRDSVVLVHSSLKAVGETEGRGEGLLETLIEYFTEDGGLLCIPTHTWKFLDDLTVPVLDMNSSRTCTGVLSSLAAAHKDAHRSIHPTHSMAVFGDNDKAEKFIQDEQKVILSTGPEGCYGKIFENSGYVLLIGVNHSKNTYLHCVEEMIGVENRFRKDSVEVKVKLKSGEIIKRPLRSTFAEGIGDVSQYYPKYEIPFRYYNCITDGKIGDAPTQLCNARKMKEVLELIRTRSGGKELLSDSLPIAEEYYK